MKINNSQHLKSLQGRITRLEAEVNALNEDKKRSQSNYDRAKLQLQDLKAQLDSLKNKKPLVSEHAIIRYLERAMKLDIKQLTNEVLTPQVIEKIVKLGDGKYPIDNNLKAIVRGNIVVTIE